MRHSPEQKQKLEINMTKAIKRLMQHQPKCITSIMKTVTLYQEIADERSNHIQAIESARHKKFFDDLNEYQDTAVNSQGYEEYREIMDDLKNRIFGEDRAYPPTQNDGKRMPTHTRLTKYIEEWNDLRSMLEANYNSSMNSRRAKIRYKLIKQGKYITKRMIFMLKCTRREEWRNAKNYYIRIGKFGNIARMINPKMRSGPVASKFYPTINGEPGRKAISDMERKEASILTHSMWMRDPTGQKNCHFLDLTTDEVGPNGISIHPDRPFDTEAQQKYLDGPLESKVDQEIIDKIKKAQQQLPELFKRISTNKKLVYPFRYDCATGLYMTDNLEINLRKNIQQGNGKARATGFAIPVLGRLPKIFVDTYLLKCKIQLALRLLDSGTENSLRICMGKPCGGVRPLTVGHDDNVFLNGLAQQAIQCEIERAKVLPENICSYQKGKGCCDATIVNCVSKEIALQNGDYFWLK